VLADGVVQALAARARAKIRRFMGWPLV